MSEENPRFQETDIILPKVMSERRLQHFLKGLDVDMSGEEQTPFPFRSNFSETDSNNFGQKYRTSSPSGKIGSRKLCDDVTVLSSITMVESSCSASNLSHLSDDESSVQESIGSSFNDSFASTVRLTEDWKWSSQQGSEMTCTNLKRLLAKFGNPFGAPLPNNPAALFLILESYLEDSNKTLEELKQAVRRKEEEIVEANRAAVIRQEALIEEHRKRVRAIIKDHEGHLSASIERARNARRQTAGIQTQLALAMSKLESLEKRYEEEDSMLRRKYTLMEEINDLKRKAEMAKPAESEVAIVTQNIKQERIDVSPVECNGEAKGGADCLRKLSSDFVGSPRRNEERDIEREDWEPVLKPILDLRMREREDLCLKLGKVEEDIAAKNRDVEKSSAQILALGTTLALLDGQIETLSAEVLKRDNALKVLQQRVDEKDALLRSLSKMVKAEKRRSSQLHLSVTISKEQEKLTLDRLKSLKRERDKLHGQCTIQQAEMATLSELLQSREKTILELQRDLENADAQLPRLFDRAFGNGSPPDWAAAVPSRLDSSCGTDLRSWDMSLESTTPFVSSQDELATAAPSRRFEWLETIAQTRSSFDADSGIYSSSSTGKCVSTVPDPVQVYTSKDTE